MSTILRYSALLCWAGLLGVCPIARAENPPRTPLWDGPAPVGDGKTADEQAFVTIWPVENAVGAVVICPGGGYGGLVTGAEGHGIAQWLNQHRRIGVVLEYRLPKGRHAVPLLDAQRAIRLVRSQAEQLHVDPHQIGIMGFSAGGHLASTAATHFDDGDPSAADPVRRVSCRPDFAILVYPVVTMRGGTHSGSRTNLLGAEPSMELIDLYSNETQVTEKTPPMFLAHAVDDKPVPIENSRMLHEALKQAGVATKLLELPSGGHGLNGYKGPMWDAWQTQSIEWLDGQR